MSASAAAHCIGHQAMERACASNAPRGIAWRLFLTCWLVYLFFLNPAGNLMSNTILGASASLAAWQDWGVPLAFPQEAPDLAVLVRRGPSGAVIRRFSGLPPGASVAAAPCYTLAWWMTRLLPSAWTRAALFRIDVTVLLNAGLQVPSNFQFLTPPLLYWLQLVAAACVGTTAAAGTVLLCYLLLSRLGRPLWQRLSVCFTLAFGTSLFPHALTYGKDPLGTFLAFAAFTLICLSPAEQRTQRRWLIPAGYLAGAALATDYWAGAIAVFLLGYTQRRAGWGGVRSLLLGLALPVGLLGLYHQALFGAPWMTPYQFRALGAIAGHQAGFAGLTGLHGPALWGLSFSPFQGVFIYHAFLLVVLIGLLARPRPALTDELLLSLGVLIGLLLAASSSKHLLMWSGAFIGWGPRRLVLATPFIALLLAGYLARTRSVLARGLVLSLAVASMGLQLLAAAWGGTLFPDPRAATLVLVSNPEALQVNPLAVMWRALLQHGFSAPLLRVYCPSETAAVRWTAVGLLLIGSACWCLWAPLFKPRPRSIAPASSPAGE